MERFIAKVEFDDKKINALCVKAKELIEELQYIMRDLEFLAAGWNSSSSEVAQKWDEENSEESSSDEMSAM